MVAWMAAHWRARKICPPGPCEMCGNPKAEVHHVNEDWQDNTPSNLQRLCRSCHMKVHRQKAACSICGKPVKGLGYCEKHYQRFKKWGDPLLLKDNQFVAVRAETETNPKRTCKIQDCDLPYHAKGYCSRHAMQMRRAGQ